MKLDLSTNKTTRLCTSPARDNLVYIAFIVFLSITSIIFSFMLPFGQAPDEMSHYQMIEEEFGTNGYVEEMNAKLWYEGEYASLPFNPAAKINPTAASKAAGEHFDLRFSIADFHISPLCLKHLPMGIGFYLGAALNLPIIVCTHMAELFATAFYVFMCCLTIRIVPVKKDIFALCMLIPETIHQCSSVSYDAVLMPCCFFLFAYILHLYYREKKVGWKDMIVIGIFTLIIAITKAPYAAIVLSILIIPASHFELRIGKNSGKSIEIVSIIRKYWYIAVILIILAACVFIYLFKETPLIKTILSDIIYFPDFLRFLKRTFSQRIYDHIHQMVGVFGWVDSFVSGQYIILFFGVMVYLNTCTTDNPGKLPNIPRRLIILTSAIAIILLVEIALQPWNYEYYGWDITADLSHYRQYIANAEVNTGIQGRYFIPCLPMILVALSGTTQRKKSAIYYLVQIAFYVVTAITIISILNNRYWIG